MALLVQCPHRPCQVGRLCTFQLHEVPHRTAFLLPKAGRESRPCSRAPLCVLFKWAQLWGGLFCPLRVHRSRALSLIKDIIGLESVLLAETVPVDWSMAFAQHVHSTSGGLVCPGPLGGPCPEQLAGTDVPTSGCCARVRRACRRTPRDRTKAVQAGMNVCLAEVGFFSAEP